MQTCKVRLSSGRFVEAVRLTADIVRLSTGIRCFVDETENGLEEATGKNPWIADDAFVPTHVFEDREGSLVLSREADGNLYTSADLFRDLPKTIERIGDRWIRTADGANVTRKIRHVDEEATDEQRSRLWYLDGERGESRVRTVRTSLVERARQEGIEVAEDRYTGGLSFEIEGRYTAYITPWWEGDDRLGVQIVDDGGTILGTTTVDFDWQNDPESDGRAYWHAARRLAEFSVRELYDGPTSTDVFVVVNEEGRYLTEYGDPWSEGEFHRDAVEFGDVDSARKRCPEGGRVLRRTISERRVD